MFALVDANNFYVSCERAFQPELENKPTIVLSNNDGCAIARSNESKALGVPMGAPLHKLQWLIKQHSIQVRSANFTLYGDMSSRLMSVIESFSPNIEVYSVDEAFVEIGQYEHVNTWAEDLQRTIFRQLGLPSSIGVARTKVLAKLASKLAKNNKGVYLLSPSDEKQVLAVTPIGDLWGVGRNLSKRLIQMGICTALQLAQADSQLIRRLFSVVLARVQDELNGQSVLNLDIEPESRQQIIVSRSFGEAVSSKEQVQIAVTKFVEEGSRKLRKQEGKARELSVSLSTNSYSKTDKQYHRLCRLTLPTDSANSFYLNRYAQSAIDQIYRDNVCYKRAGIILMELSSENQYQTDLFKNEPSTDNSDLDSVKDSINHRFGRMTLKPAVLFSEKQQWKMKREHLSREYTTNWDDLMCVS